MKVRTFVSVKMRDTSSLEEAVSDISALDNVRASDASQLHITLRFIGDVEEKRLPELSACVKKACEGVHPFTVRVEGLGCFPNPGLPSVIWVGARSDGILEEISERLSEELSRRRFDFDDKPFKGHVTIGRCRGPADVGGVLEKYRGREFTSFECGEVLLMKSVLGPAGARHSVLDRFGLL